MTVGQLFGTAYLAYHLRGQAHYPFLPLATIRRDQSRRVRATVAYAYRHVPYYRETLDRLGLTPDDFRTVEDLVRLPVLETSEYQRDPERFLSTAQPREAYLAMSTSGSTGRPRTIYHDWREVAQNAAHAERERCMVTALLGHPRTYRESVFIMAPNSGHSYLVQQMLRRHVWLPRRVGAQRQQLLSLDPAEKNVALLNEFKPDVFASGTYLVLLFGYLYRTGRPCHMPKVITYGSEGVPEAVRRLIMDEFHVPVLSTYQATEAFKLGFECDQHRGYHLNLDLYPLRLVDPEGRTVPIGTTGEVVMSNLVNRATVLLNYRLNDLATLLPDPCPCGRTLPLLSFLQGRGKDFLNFGSGRVVHPTVLEGLFSSVPGIWQYQVRQQQRLRLAVAVVAAPAVDLEGARRRLVEGFKTACGEDVTVDLSFVEAIPCTPGGKILPVVALPEGAEA